MPKRTNRRNARAEKQTKGSASPNAFLRPNPKLDVFVRHDALPDATLRGLRDGLDSLAWTTLDFRGNHYQNILDPKATHQDHKEDSDSYRWIASEFDVRTRPAGGKKDSNAEATHSSQLVSPIQDLPFLPPSSPSGFPEEREVDEPSHRQTFSTHGRRRALVQGIQDGVNAVFEAALPALSCVTGWNPRESGSPDGWIERMRDYRFPILPNEHRWRGYDFSRRPLLEPPYTGHIQAIVKAQRVIVGERENYESVWHEEGLHEHIMAVILYYYRNDTAGGALEFADKSDVGVDVEECDRESADLNQAWAARETTSVLPREGTLVVFNNTNMVHKVSQMRYRRNSILAPVSSSPLPTSGNTSTAPTPHLGTNTPPARPGGDGCESSRDFLALFVVDPRFPVPSNVRNGQILAGVAHAFGGYLPSQLSTLILLYLGATASMTRRQELRQKVFARQMEPQRCGGFQVYCAGNWDLHFVKYQDQGLADAAAITK